MNTSLFHQRPDANWTMKILHRKYILQKKIRLQKKIVNIVIVQVAKKDCQHCHCSGCKAGWVHRVQAGSAPERGEHKNKNTNKKRYPKDVWRCPPKGGELPRHRATATTRRVRDDPQGGLRECSQAGRQLGKNVPKPVNSDKYDSYLCRWRNSSAPKSHERSAPR